MMNAYSSGTIILVLVKLQMEIGFALNVDKAIICIIYLFNIIINLYLQLNCYNYIKCCIIIINLYLQLNRYNYIKRNKQLQFY